ncbi:hypothetical protein [Paenibacillus senegalimassiliensis]|uniref:hypothetical protein n=1 Tax=Paenibacillus senegalimassiliensis TaxID=1737426 RepID=UPI00073E51D9|nr:hypothetical protein [Paenibacillus senegalimassiliensis]
MWTIPASYEGFMRRRNLTWDMKVNVNGVDYGRDVVMDFSIDRRLVSSDEFMIGTANMGKLEIKLRLQHELPANAKIVPFLGLSVGNLSWQDAHIPWAEAHFPWSGGNLGWIPMGEFYIDSRERLKNIWVYTCFDKLYLADGAFLSNLTYPATMQAVWDEICSRLGYMYDSSVVINPNYKIPAGPAGFTMRQTMGFIASANGASVFVGRDGTIKFKRFAASAATDFDMNESDYHRLALTNPEKSYSRIVIGYDGEEGVRFEAGTGSENETLYIDNPYATQAMANALLVQLNGFSYVPIDMNARGYPHLEPGDVIEFERKESMSWQDANLSWQDAHFPWDGVYRQQSIILIQSFTYRGGLVMSLESPSSSEQQSEFPTPGPITQEINRLNRDAVKLGRKYYGVGFTRENGFQLNREDGLSEVIWNSDVMDWKVDDERVLYLDVLERKLKFNGHLEAATGTFSGDLNAAGGTFRGDLSAAGGTFTGTLQGVDGTFSGNLSAAGGTFRGNLSAAGGTFTGTLVGVDGTFSGTLNAATFNGGRIIGAEIMTSASSYPRAEMSSSNRMFSVWASSGRGIEMGAFGGSGGSYMDFRDGGSSASIYYGGSSGLYIQSGPGRDIDLRAADINLFASGYVYVNDWNDFRSRNGGDTLQYALNEKADISFAGYNLAFDSATRNLKMFSRDGNLLAQVNIP